MCTVASSEQKGACGCGGLVVDVCGVLYLICLRCDIAVNLFRWFVCVCVRERQIDEGGWGVSQRMCVCPMDGEIISFRNRTSLLMTDLEDGLIDEGQGDRKSVV